MRSFFISRNRRISALLPAAVLVVAMATPWLPGRAGAGAAQQPVKSEAPELTTGTVQALLDKVNASTALSDAVKSKVVEVYKQALEQLRLAREWAGKADAFERDRTQAPERLKALKESLSKPLADPDLPSSDTLQTMTVSEIRQALAGARAEFETWSKQLSEVEQEDTRRNSRRVEVPKLIADARSRLETAQQSQDAPPMPGDPPELTTARLIVSRALARAIQEELRSYEAEIPSYEARRSLLTARRDEAARHRAQAEDVVRFWEQALQRRQNEEARRAQAEAAQTLQEVVRTSAPAVIRELARENQELAEARTARDGLLAKIEQAEQELAEKEGQFAFVKSEFEDIQKRIEKIGLTNSVGVLLRRNRDKLPRLREVRSRLERRTAELATAELRLDDLRAERTSLTPVSRAAQRMEAQLPRPVSDDMRSSLTLLLQSKRDNIDALIQDYDAYVQALADLDGLELELLQTAEKFLDYIGENILWIKSAQPLAPSDLPKAAEAAQWVLQPAGWFGRPGDRLGVFPALHQDFLLAPLVYIIFVGLFILALSQRRRLIRLLTRLGESPRRVGREYQGLEALAVTILIALVWPLLLWFLWWRLGILPDDTAPLTRGVAAACHFLAVRLFGIEVILQLCRSRGVGEAHLEWPVPLLDRIRENLRWFMLIGLPLVFAIRVLAAEGSESQYNSLGRFLFICLMLLIGTLTARVLRKPAWTADAPPKGGHTHRADRIRAVSQFLAVAVPAVLALIAAAGYFYSATELARGILTSAWVLPGIIVPATLLEGVLVRVHARQVARRAAAAASDEEEDVLEDDDSTVLPAYEPLDLTTTHGQLRRLIQIVAGFALLICLWNIWHELLPALGILGKVEIWSYMSEATARLVDAQGVETMQRVPTVVEVTIADLFLSILIVVVSFAASQNIPGLLEVTFLQRLPLDAAIRYAVTAITRYILILAGLVYAAEVIGLSWSKLQWLAAGVGVGLGFGLQEVFANFICGLIIFVERPIRVGDIVTVNDISGQVTRIQIRATTILDWDRRELIVPNKSFITGNLVNWTLTDKKTRVTVSVGIAYGSDTEKARGLLLQIARETPHVVEDPPPRAVFMAFGDSTLNFNLYVHIPNRDVYLEVVNALNTGIDAAFKKAKIEIAFPQRDLHLRSSDIPFPVEIKSEDGREAAFQTQPEEIEQPR